MWLGRTLRIKQANPSAGMLAPHGLLELSVCTEREGFWWTNCEQNVRREYHIPDGQDSNPR